MTSNSKIEWTDITWNPVTGCTKVSPGCKNCYAERMSKRLKAMKVSNYVNGFNLTVHENMLDKPFQWKKPRMIFVNSMSDLFHKDVPPEFIKRIFEVMNKADWHQFQILTKRDERLLELANELEWSENIWMGVSVEAGNYVDRIDRLRLIPAKVRFLSLEPLIAPISNLNLEGIHWVIVGGESGPGARPIKKEWVIEIKNQCVEQNVPFFFKQWGGTNKKKTGRELQGRVWNQYPVGISI